MRRHKMVPQRHHQAETEARWRLADSLVKLDKGKEAEAEPVKLVATGLDDQFVELARRKLAALKT